MTIIQFELKKFILQKKNLIVIFLFLCLGSYVIVTTYFEERQLYREKEENWTQIYQQIGDILQTKVEPQYEEERIALDGLSNQIEGLLEHVSLAKTKRNRLKLVQMEQRFYQSLNAYQTEHELLIDESKINQKQTLLSELIERDV